MMQRTIGIGLLVLLGAAARAAPDDLDELLHLLAERQHGHVDFVEQHFLALLSRPVESSGELIYDAPDRLEKRTLEPRQESLMLAGDMLSIRRGRRRHVLDLKAYPQILPFIESIRATLAGDRDALERTFRVEYAGDLDALDTAARAAGGVKSRWPSPRSASTAHGSICSPWRFVKRTVTARS